jgi:hypothetical protein
VIHLTNASGNYIINAQASFDATPEGVAWLIAALNASLS